MELVYFLKVLYRKKWIILGLSLLAVLATFILLGRKKPLYQSTTQYSTGFTAEKMRLADGSSAIDIYTIEVKFDNVIATIKSPQVINKVGYEMMLHDLLDTTKAYTRLTPKEMGAPAYKEMPADTARRILLEKITKNEFLKGDIYTEKVLMEYLKLYKYDYLSILGNLLVQRVDRTDYLDLTFQSVNPELAAVMVNKIGDEFLNYYKSINSRRTNESAESIKTIMESQQGRVDSLNKILISEKVSQGSFDPLSRSSTAMETISSLETKLADERGKYNEHSNRLVYLRARLNALNAGGGNISRPNNDEVVRLTRQKDELVKELSRKGGNDPALQQQINELRTEIVLKSNSGTSKTKNKEEIDQISREISEEEAMMKAAASTIADYSASIRKYSGMTNVSAGSDVKMDVIRSQLDIENKQLVNVKDKFTQVQGLSKDDPTANFIQTRMGQPAAEPQSKRTFITMLLAGASVFFLASVLFIFLEIFDSSIKLPSIFNKISKIKTAGIVNSINLKNSPAMTVVMNDVKASNNQELFKNSIRKLRYEILNSGKKAFLFTSTQKKVGKSAIVEALAGSLLMGKKKVLIIDLNFAHNTLTERFAAKVFIEDFTGRNKGLNMTQINHSKTDTEGLYIIGCKPGNVTPVEELHNLDMRSFIEELKEEFDFILVEGAALNHFADSREIAAFADGIFTVFGADDTLSRADQDSMKFISDNHSKNLGAILNKVYAANMQS
ncbi:MAG: hypothetical protein WAT19_13190 [Ferruginibacter sp.]